MNDMDKHDDNSHDNIIKANQCIDDSKIKMIGKNWCLLPIIKKNLIHKKEIIVGWKLQFTYNSKPFYKNITNIMTEINPIIITTKIIEADIDRKDGYSIFKTTSGFYYMVKDIDQEFYKNYWIRESPHNLYLKLQTNNLVSHGDIEDLNISNVQYIKPMNYTIYNTSYVNYDDDTFNYFDQMISNQIKNIEDQDLNQTIE